MTGTHQEARRGFARAASLLCLAVAALLVVASAHTAEAQLNDKLRKCRSRVAQHVRKVSARVLDARNKCVGQKLRGAVGISVDCMADPQILGGPGTGDLKTDERLAAVSDIINKQAAKIETNCNAFGRPEDMETRLDGICDPADYDFNDWSDVVRCAALEVAKPAGEKLAELLEISQPSGVPLAGDLQDCYFRIARNAKGAEKRFNRFRHDCFTRNDKLIAQQKGSPLLECSAINAPPGVVQTTNLAKLDARLSSVLVGLRFNAYTSCDVNLEELGFPDTSGGAMGDRTAGAGQFTAEDLFTVLADAVLEETTIVDAALYPLENYCGDGVQDNSGCGTGPGGSDIFPCEECDDGNRKSCDGCDRDCSLPRCGNGAACGPDECDDGNNDSGDGCSAICISEYCGDGIAQIIIGEQCDDGNPVDGDGCDINCTVTGCGNGIVTAPEVCDDGNNNSDTNPNANCRTNCTLVGCGDGVIANAEQCDERRPDTDVRRQLHVRAVRRRRPSTRRPASSATTATSSTATAATPTARRPTCGNGIVTGRRGVRRRQPASTATAATSTAR